MMKARTDTRILGDFTGRPGGPVIIALAGVHGNEGTGVEAVRQVLRLLGQNKQEINGRFIGLRGNMTALRQQVRYNSEDMNRLWTPSLLDKIRRTSYRNLVSEDRAEIKDLLRILDPIVFDASIPEVILVDLHTFSGTGGMFCIVPRDDDLLKGLAPLNIPLIFGINKTLPGTSMDYMAAAGRTGFAFETGTHGTGEAEQNATAGLLMLLVRTHLIKKEYVPGYDEYAAYLNDKAGEYPRKLEFVYKHVIESGDDFVMQPGYRNFDKIKKGDLLGRDKNGEIRALADGFMLMPLYQKQGNDGFFIINRCR